MFSTFMPRGLVLDPSFSSDTTILQVKLRIAHRRRSVSHRPVTLPKVACFLISQFDLGTGL